MNDTLYMHHVREAGYCATGVRRFCKKHGLNFSTFLREGFPVQDMERIDDAMVKTIIDKLRKTDGK